MADHYCVVCHSNNPSTRSCRTCQQRAIAALTSVPLGNLRTSHKVSPTSGLRNQATISWADCIKLAATGTWSFRQLMPMHSLAITCQKWWSQRHLLFFKAIRVHLWHLHRFPKFFSATLHLQRQPRMSIRIGVRECNLSQGLRYPILTTRMIARQHLSLAQLPLGILKDQSLRHQSGIMPYLRDQCDMPGSRWDNSSAS